MCLSACVYHFFIFFEGWGWGVTSCVIFFVLGVVGGKVIHYLVNYYFLGGRVSLQVLLYFGGGGWGESDTLLLLLFFFLGGVFDFLKFFVLVFVCVLEFYFWC